MPSEATVEATVYTEEQSYTVDNAAYGILTFNHPLRELMSRLLSVNALSPMFAVIIGINAYQANDVVNLTGACEDAKDMLSFIRNRLCTPPENIVALENEQATRPAIKTAILNLAVNPRIRENDPILIYFAGHGSRTQTSPFVEMILPYDFSRQSVDSEIGQGLLDLTISRLLTHVADAKGNNIVSILHFVRSTLERLHSLTWITQDSDI